MIFKKFFALLFIASMAIFLYFQFFSTPTVENHTNKNIKTEMHQKPYMPSVSIETSFSGDDDFIMLSSLITSILSFLGFILSTYHSMKNHRRGEEIFDLRKERERLELEKIQAEIQALRGG